MEEHNMCLPSAIHVTQGSSVFQEAVAAGDLGNTARATLILIKGAEIRSLILHGSELAVLIDRKNTVGGVKVHSCVHIIKLFK